ncbi:MAG TPA: S9 family peptidase [Vicinamibacterales bacterium]|nr:S9 family peptidase [Vicinamibacterales bacterium]
MPSRHVSAPACLGVVLLAASLAAQGRRSMTVDDLIGTVRVGDLSLSPDGRTVVFVRTTTDLATGRRNADLWSVPADGSAPPRALVASEASETAPRYTPDGARLVYISTAGGAPQVWVAAADGSGARQVTSLSAGVQAPLVVSPDGRHAAFVSDVYAGCRDEACNRQRREAAEKDPVDVRRLTRLMFRHWDEWRHEQHHHVIVADLESGRTRDLTPGDFDSPPHFYEDHAIAFSPDGTEVAYVSKGDIGDAEAWTTNHDVWIVPVAGGEPRRATTNPAADMQPVFSPDGRLLAVRAQRRPGFESDRWYIDLYDRRTGGRRTLFESVDLSVGDFAFAPDGRSIWFTAEEQGAVNLYTVPVAGGDPRRVVAGGAVGAFAMGSGFTVYLRSSLTAPPEIFRVDDAAAPGPSSGGPAARERVLTRENAAWLREVEMPAVESRSVTAPDGARIHYWLLRPPRLDPSKRAPVVFLIHGGPQGAWNDAWSFRWNPALWASQGWIIAAPNPRGSTGFGQRFVDEISRDWCGKVMADLDAVFDDVARLPFADSKRMAVAGASYGGYAVNWIIGQTDRFRAAVSHDGVFNLESMALSTEELWFVEWEFGGTVTSEAARAGYRRCSPHLHAEKIRTPTLVITNELDFRVPVDQGLQLFTALRRNGVPAEALVFPDEGHWVLKALNSRRWHEAVFGWLRAHLEAPPATGRAPAR